MGRILAIDYGTKRIGLAVTDPLQIIASPLTTVETSKALDFIVNYIASETVDCIVLGEPKNLDDTPTHATQPALDFKKTLEKNFPTLPVKLVDETFTSKIAARALVTGNFKKKERQKKENLDKVSATLILQSYLDSIK